MKSIWIILLLVVGFFMLKGKKTNNNGVQLPNILGGSNVSSQRQAQLSRIAQNLVAALKGFSSDQKRALFIENALAIQSDQEFQVVEQLFVQHTQGRKSLLKSVKNEFAIKKALVDSINDKYAKRGMSTRLIS